MAYVDCLAREDFGSAAVNVIVRARGPVAILKAAFATITIGIERLVNLGFVERPKWIRYRTTVTVWKL